MITYWKVIGVNDKTLGKGILDQAMTDSVLHPLMLAWKTHHSNPDVDEVLNKLNEISQAHFIQEISPWKARQEELLNKRNNSNNNNNYSRNNRFKLTIAQN